MAAWVFAPRIRRRWGLVATTYGVALAAAGMFLLSDRGLPNLVAITFLISIFVASATATLLTIGGWWLAKAYGSRAAPRDEPFTARFTVGQLLIVTLFTAIGAALLKPALPAWKDSDPGSLAVLIFQNAILALIAAQLFMGKRINLWRVAILAGGGVALSYASLWLTSDFEFFFYSNAVQVAVLLATVALPQLDRYHIRVEWTPRDADESEPL